MAPYNLSPHLETLLARRELSPDAAAEVMRAIMEGRLSAANIAAFAVALRAKGETVDELAAFARVMRSAAIPVQSPPGTLDTCGTGGDKSSTFNISTAAALVVAGMGIPVAKHGGKSASSSTGSADVLKELGVNIEANAECVGRCIKSANIGFMFAPSHHPGMKNVAPVRRDLGIRTVFNMLGPLSNPAGAKLQLIGVFDPSLCKTFAQVLKALGSESAMIVCGAGPGGTGHLDEFSTFGPSTYARLSNDRIDIETLDAASLGIPIASMKSLFANTPTDSATIIRAVLNGEKGAPRDIVCLNAAAAALVAGKASDWNAGMRLAGLAIDSGAALEALTNLIKASAQ